MTTAEQETTHAQALLGAVVHLLSSAAPALDGERADLVQEAHRAVDDAHLALIRADGGEMAEEVRGLKPWTDRRDDLRAEIAALRGERDAALEQMRDARRELVDALNERDEARAELQARGAPRRDPREIPSGWEQLEHLRRANEKKRREREEPS